MRMEDALTAMGNNPISGLENFRAAVAYFNGFLSKLNVGRIDESTPSDKVLEIIYGLEDPDLQNRLLDRSVVEVAKDKDKRFKNLLTISTLIITITLIVVVGMSLATGAPMSAEAIELWKTALTNIFEIIKAVIPLLAN